MIGKTISHYRILEKIGSGGMGEVFLAEDTKLKRQVALKFLPRQMTTNIEAKERFEREAQATAALNHHNIVTIHEIGEHEGQVFIAMEYIEGQTLKEIISGNLTPSTLHPMPIPLVLDIATQLASGLAAAHAKGIVHRDIKPQNILVDKDNRVKILDFGLAKLKGVSSLTKESSTLGTVHYMSPEQTMGKEVDHRTDIWSFGVVLYEMLTGLLPFKGDYEQAIIYSILNEKPEPLEKQSAAETAELEAIIGKCLEKESQARYQHADELLADLRHERKCLEQGKTGQVSRKIAAAKAKKFKWPLAAAAVAVVAAALFFFLFSPFKVRIGQRESIQAQENSLAVMYFENLQDPEDKSRTSQMITALLTTGLSDSPRYIQVVSSQRLFDILKLLGKENLKVIDKTVASEVARKAGVQWMVTGKVLREEPNIVLVAEISDAATGKIKATQRVNGAPGEDLFAVVDKLSPQVVQAMALPEQAQKELEKPVAELTTRSLDAYRAYIAGLENYYKIFLAEAEKDLKKALEYDPDFAMAHYWLAQINFDRDNYQAASESLAQAQKRSVKMSRREKLYVQALSASIGGKYDQAIERYREITVLYPEDKDAFFLLGETFVDELGNLPEGIRCLLKAIAIDPNFKRAYNSLALIYSQTEDFEKSLWAINQYIALAPDEPNPYDTRGEIYALNGQLDAAIESLKKAVAIKPDFYGSVVRLACLYIFKQEYAQAEKCFKRLTAADNPLTQAYGRSLLALIPMYQGRLRLALEVLEKTIVANRSDQKYWQELEFNHFCKARILEERGELGLAIREIETALKIHKKADPENPFKDSQYYVYLLSKNGQIAGAEAVFRELRKQRFFKLAASAIALAKNDLKGAQNSLENVHINNIFGVYVLAGIDLRLGVLDKAATLLEKMLARHTNFRFFEPIASVKAHYLLGQAYERSGWKDKAIEQYSEFLNIWKNADPGLPEVVDARQRLEKLKKL